MADPVIIEVAINGATTKARQPHVPITREEMVADALACLEDDDPSPTFTELVSNQRAGKARADDGDIPQYFVDFPSHGLAPSVHATTNQIADLIGSRVQ